MKRSRNNQHSQPRRMQALTTRGLQTLTVNDEAAEIITYHWLAVILFLNTGAAGLLSSLDECKQLTDDKHTIALETDPQVIGRHAPRLRLFIAHQQAVALAGLFGFETAAGGG